MPNNNINLTIENSSKSIQEQQSAITKIELPTAEQNNEPGALKEAVDEHGLPLLPTGDAVRDREIKELHKIIRQERSHGQWSKQGLNLISLICILLQSLLRGS